MKIVNALYCALLLLSSCTWELPAEKTLKNCQKPTAVVATPDPLQPKKITFTIGGATVDVVMAVWKITSSTGKLVSSVTNSTASNYTATLADDGTYTLSLDLTTTCNDVIQLTNTFTVNSQLPVASSFSLTDPMVHIGLNAVVVTNDGTIIANDLNEIKVWNPATRTLLKTWKGNTNPIASMALSPDEKYLYTSPYSTAEPAILVWDWKAGTLAKTLTGGTYGGYLQLSADGKYLASLEQGNIRVWDTGTGQLTRTITFPATNWYINGLAISSTGNYVSGVFSDGSSFYFVVWNFQTGAEVWRQTSSSASYTNGLAFSPDGQQLYFSYYSSSANGYKIQLWNIATKQLSKEVDGDYGFSLSVDGRYILSAQSLFDTPNVTKLWSRSMFGFAPGIFSLSSSNQYIARAGGGAIELLQATTGVPLTGAYNKHPTTIVSAAFSKDYRILATLDYSGIIKTWDLTTGQTLITHAAQTYYSGSNGIGITPDNRYIISTGPFNSLKIVSVADGSLVRTIAASGTNYTNETIIAADGSYFVSGGSNNTVLIRDPNTGNTIRTLTGHTGEVRGLAISPDNKTIASIGIDYTLRIWDATTGNQLQSISASLNGIKYQTGSISYSPDGQFISATLGPNIASWNVSNGQLLASWSTVGGLNLQTMAYSPNGKLLATGGFDNKVKIWNSPAGTLFNEIQLAYPIRKIVFSPDGNKLYAVTQKDVQVLTVQ